MKIPTFVHEALRTATIDGNRLVLGGPRMSTRNYRVINDILEAAGAHWDRNTQAHLFPGDAADAVKQLLAADEIVSLREQQQATQYFPTPQPVVRRLVEAAGLKPGMRVLEPSAGQGAIVCAAHAAGCVVDAVELEPGNADVLKQTGALNELTVADFLALPPEPVYDRVLMNPPFTHGADITHVTHALRFLAPGGLLVAVMCRSLIDDRVDAAQFRALVEQRGGIVEELPAKSFIGSGTPVDTLLVTIPAVRRPDAKATVWPVRELPPAEQEDLRPPLEIARELSAVLRESVAEMDDLVRMLETGFPVENVSSTPVPVPARVGQLVLDLGGEPSC